MKRRENPRRFRLSKKSVFALARERQSLPLMREANWSISDNLTEGENIKLTKF